MAWLGDYVGRWFGDWFGLSGSDPNALSASIGGAGSVSATLTATGTAIDQPSGGIWRAISRRLLRIFQRRGAAARLVGSGHVRATLTAAPYAATTRGRLERLLSLLDE